MASGRGKRIRNTVVSIIVGGIIAWFLLSKIDPRDVPRAVGNIPLWSLMIAFLLYTISVYLKAVRFKIILRTGISLRELFPMVSLYMFFANILPMRAGELSYVYLLKKQAGTPGTKSFASLVVGGIADATLILMAMFVVGWHLRGALAEGTSYFLSALEEKSRLIGLWAHRLMGSWAYGLMVAIVLIVGGVIGFLVFGFRFSIHRFSPVWKSRIGNLKSKIMEVYHELAGTSFDIRLLGIIACSISIIAFRFGTQWYLVRAMGIAIGIWKLSFALLFGVLFSLVPMHGPAGFGTVEAPWVLALLVLSVPKEDAITSGFGLHIIVIMYCVILGLYGILDLRLWRPKIENRKSKIRNV